MSRREEFVDEVARASAAYESYLADVEQVEARIRQQVQEHLAESREAALAAIRDLAKAGGTKYQLTKVLKTRNWNKVLKWWDEALGTTTVQSNPHAGAHVENPALPGTQLPEGWQWTQLGSNAAELESADGVVLNVVNVGDGLEWRDGNDVPLSWDALLALPDAVVDWATENI